MSALGQELTSASRSGMSALPLKADMLGVGINVCFVPKADIGGAECGRSRTGSCLKCPVSENSKHDQKKEPRG